MAALDVRCLVDIWAETSSRWLDGRELGPQRECGRDGHRVLKIELEPHTPSTVLVATSDKVKTNG